ncbi:hypothetical protein ACFL2Q_08530 [Thermodesulfobacteriota bacterium]
MREAKKLLERALAIREKAFGIYHQIAKETMIKIVTLEDQSSK